MASMDKIAVGDTVTWHSPLFGEDYDATVKGFVESDTGEWVVIDFHPVTHQPSKIIPDWIWKVNGVKT